MTTSREINESNDEHLFNDLVIPIVEVLTLDHHSLKAIQSDDRGFPSESLWKLKEVTLTNLEEESVPFLFNFLRGIRSLEKLARKEGCLSEIFSYDDEREIRDQNQQYHLVPKHLHFYCVSKLKHIVEKDSKLNPISQCFQTLRVSFCKDMMNIAAPSSVSFINLTTLRVFCCDKMKSLVTASTAKSMIQLMELKVSGCEMMKDIIVANEDGDFTEEHDDDDVIVFNKLKHLELNKLPNLNNFCSGNYIFNFPLLEQVYIGRCHQMKYFCGGEVSTPKLRGVQYEYAATLWEGNLNAAIALQVQENG